MGFYTTGTTLILGHRGAKAHAPDNTLEAFALALDHGADGVELDVRRTADDVLILHHDASTPATGPFITLPFQEIRQIDGTIPTLDEALETLRGTVINVEIKNVPGQADFDREHIVARRIAAWVVENGLLDQVIVSSFDPPTVATVRATDKRVATALLTYLVDPLEAVQLAADAGHDAIHPDAASLVAAGPKSVVAAAAERGMHVATWTVNDLDVAAALAADGVAAIVTDDPARLRTVVP